jgi:hypothetical protein
VVLKRGIEKLKPSISSEANNALNVMKALDSEMARIGENQWSWRKFTHAGYRAIYAKAHTGQDLNEQKLNEIKNRTRMQFIARQAGRPADKKIAVLEETAPFTEAAFLKCVFPDNSLDDPTIVGERLSGALKAKGKAETEALAPLLPNHTKEELRHLSKEKVR